MENIDEIMDEEFAAEAREDDSNEELETTVDDVPINALPE